MTKPTPVLDATWYDTYNTSGDGTSDIVYSPDDGGWYAQRWRDDKTTDIYNSRGELTAALRDSKVKWE